MAEVDAVQPEGVLLPAALQTSVTSEINEARSGTSGLQSPTNAAQTEATVALMPTTLAISEKSEPPKIKDQQNGATTKTDIKDSKAAAKEKEPLVDGVVAVVNKSNSDGEESIKMAAKAIDNSDAKQPSQTDATTSISTKAASSPLSSSPALSTDKADKTEKPNSINSSRSSSPAQKQTNQNAESAKTNVKVKMTNEKETTMLTKKEPSASSAAKENSKEEAQKAANISTDTAKIEKPAAVDASTANNNTDQNIKPQADVKSKSTSLPSAPASSSDSPVPNHNAKVEKSNATNCDKTDSEVAVVPPVPVSTETLKPAKGDDVCATNDKQLKPPSSPSPVEGKAADGLSESATVDKKVVQAAEAAKEAAETAKDETVKKVVNDELHVVAKPSAGVPMEVDEEEDENDDPLAVDPLLAAEKPPVSKQLPPPQKENGMASEMEKVRNESVDTSEGSGIVDLGDDSDEDMEEEDDEEQQIGASANGGDFKLKLTPIIMDDSRSMMPSKKHSICSDSDGAVVIGSDSGDEAPGVGKVRCESLTRPLGMAVLLPPAPPSSSSSGQLMDDDDDDDDDDDCVVIEDDSPEPATIDLTKRKLPTLADFAHAIEEAQQPPLKRQRNSAPSGVSQITIKDARSLMPQDVATAAAAAAAAAVAVMKRATEGNVYPVNITPAQGPPKLVPMNTLGTLGNSPVGNLSALTGSGLPGLNTCAGANVLPGLTDDMFVLEAPSFIVPYIYEKPPPDNLTEIVREIETKYKLSKEELAEADKPDEFDMMTEQNKDENLAASATVASKKKKRGRGGDDADDSWSEDSEEDEDDDDDDDSDSAMRTKVLIKEVSDDLTALKGAIKPASAVAQSSTPLNAAAKPGQENYFESPLGKFFMDIGVGLVQEFVQSDLIRLQKRKMRKSLGKNITEFERAISALSGNLEASKKKNSTFKFTMKRCEFCNFKSESALAMANHYETPHMNGLLYKCNFCTFEIRNATEIVYHMEAVHNIKARLIKPLPYHQCPNCGFEDNGKAKLARHQPVCAKKYRPELNLAPPNDWEAPAKIPRIKPRHGLVGTATAYQAMAAQAAAQKAALASIQQQQQAAQARNLQAAAVLAAQNAANKIRGRPPTITKPTPNSGAVLRGVNQVRTPMVATVAQVNNYPLAGGQLMQTASAMVKKTLSGQPSISITPLPRQSAVTPPSTPSTSKMPAVCSIKPGQNPAAAGNKAQFVICEICDGYIKDLEQLRNHMQWMHKVKIHPKMIYNRPPLNCQKCQFRFFTDQGLERHLLGSHGLVTSSMQEAANKGKDAGRCPVCGRMYQWKLLNHVSRDHHMTLKPAHLSYKCTVCTATFGMYKQFETHVYTAHSTVAKKAVDGKKNNNALPNSGASTSAVALAVGSNRVGGISSALSGISSACSISSNDSLLKPLKINDEITIIPQPASKPRITNMESHVID